MSRDSLLMKARPVINLGYYYYMKTLITFFFSLVLALPVVALAQEPSVLPNDFVGPPTAAQSQAAGARLSNPLNGADGEIDDVGALFDDILSNIIIPLTLAVGVLFIVLAGLKFVTATGNGTKITEAKQNLQYTLIGVAVVLSAEILLDILLSTLKEIGNVG